MGTGDKTVVDTRNGWATRGFFGRVNYDYDGRYLLEMCIRDRTVGDRRTSVEPG